MKKIIFLIMICFLLSSCDEVSLYKIEKGKDGTIYKMHRFTGEMTIIKDGNVITEKEIKQQNFLDKLGMNPETWDYTIKQLKLDVAIQIKWIDNKLYYTLYLQPKDEDNDVLSIQKKEIKAGYYGKKNPTFTINFYDSDSFELMSQNILLVKMICEINDEGKETALAYRGDLHCSRDIYKRISYADVSWVLPKRWDYQ